MTDFGRSFLVTRVYETCVIFEEDDVLEPNESAEDRAFLIAASLPSDGWRLISGDVEELT